MATQDHIHLGTLTPAQMEQVKGHRDSVAALILALHWTDQRWGIIRRTDDYILLHPRYAKSLADEIMASGTSKEFANATHHYHYGDRAPSEEISELTKKATQPFEVTFDPKRREFPKHIRGAKVRVAFMSETERRPPNVFAVTVHANGQYVGRQLRRSQP